MHQKSLHCLALGLIALLSLNGPTALSAPPTWGDLQQGPHAVGFETIERYDYSRAFTPKKDYLGNVLPGERARPIQICIWYPAEASEDAYPMVYGEYGYAYPEDESFIGVLSQLHGRELQHDQSFFATRGQMADMQNLQMAAVKDAEKAEGTFPLVLYHPHAEGSYCENAVMCEYLASHGFVVATAHPLGTTQITPRVEANDLTTILRDITFVKGVMRDYPQTDLDHFGLFGWGLGSVSALWMQMQDTDVDAVVDLGGALAFDQVFELIRENPYFRPERMQVPHLQLCPSDNPAPNPALIDSLVHSKRYVGYLTGLTWNDFTHYPTLAGLVIDTTGGEMLKARKASYAVVTRYVANFFKGYLTNDGQAMAFLTNPPADNGVDAAFLSMTQAEARAVPPTPEQFMAIIQNQGVEPAAEIFNRFRAENPELVLFPEATFNMLGYRYLQGGQTPEALVVFRMNRDTYPGSANSWDSYAEACMSAGNNEEAIECFRKALELLETDATIDPRTREGIERSARQNLEQLEQ